MQGPEGQVCMTWSRLSEVSTAQTECPMARVVGKKSEGNREDGNTWGWWPKLIDFGFTLHSEWE